MLQSLRQLWRDEAGIATVEYAFLLVSVALAGAAAWQSFGDVLSSGAQSETEHIANVSQ